MRPTAVLTSPRAGSAILALVGGLLLVRLVLLLFAVRPNNPVAELLLGVTGPLVGPFAGLDRSAHQPIWGARLELASVASLLIVVLVLVLLRWAGQKGNHA